MANPAKQSYSMTRATGTRVLMASAGLLILLGIVFQLAELGYGQVVPGEGWLLSVVASDLWNVIALHLNMSAFQEIMRFWPLLLVCAGGAMLAVRKSAGETLAAQARTNNHYGE